MKKIGFFLLFIAIISVGSGLFLFLNSPKRAMLSIVSKQIELFDKKNTKLKKEKYEIKGSTKISFNDTNLYDITNELHIDSINEKLYSRLKGNYIDKEGKDQSAENMPQIYIEKNRLFFRVDGKLSYLEFDSSDNSIIASHKKRSLEYEEFLNVIKDYIVNKLPSENFSSVDSRTSVVNNVIDVKKYSLFLTSNDLKDLFRYILDEIYYGNNMPNLKEIMTKNITKENAIKQFNDAINKIYKTDKKIVEYSIYVKNNKIVKSAFELNSNDSGILISFGSYEKDTDVFDYELDIIKGSKKIFHGTIVGDKMGDKIEGTYGNYEISGEIVQSSDNKSLNINVHDTNDKSKEVLVLNVEYKEVLKDLEYKVEVNATSNKDEGKMVLSNTTTIRKDKEVPSFDISKAEKVDIGKLFKK